MKIEYAVPILTGVLIVSVLIAGYYLYSISDHGATVEEIDEYGGIIFLDSDSDYIKSDKIYVDKESNVWIEGDYIIVENPRYIDGVVCINKDSVTYIQIYQ